MVKDTNYYCVQGWMVTELGLKGNDLAVYAIIYGFAQNDTSYTGSLSYLAEWTNSTKQGVLKNLKNLQEKGLITKHETFKNDIKFCEYKLIPLNKVKQGVLNKVVSPIKQSLPNNIEDNTNINNIDDIVSKDTNSLDINNSNQLFPTSSKPKKKGENKYITVIENSAVNENVRNALQKYLAFRRKRGLTVDQWELIVSRFKNDSKGKTIKEIVNCIERCIIDGCNSLYYKNTYQNNTFSPPPQNQTPTEYSVDNMEELRRKREFN